MTSHELLDEPQAPGTMPRGETQEASLARPAGPAAAVVLGAGLGCFTLGLLSVLTAASSTASDDLTLSNRVGDVSGISTAAAAVFFIAWAALTVAWRRADPPLLRVAAVSALLLALGLLGTFPPFFNLFG
jgi:hypothetical protein